MMSAVTVIFPGKNITKNLMPAVWGYCRQKGCKDEEACLCAPHAGKTCVGSSLCGNDRKPNAWGGLARTAGQRGRGTFDK